MTSQKILQDLFRSEIIHFENKKWPTLTGAQIARADSSVNREFGKALQESRKLTKEEIEDGEVTPEQLSKAQKEWEAYLHAWAAFVHVRYPNEEAAIKAQIEMDRYRLLETI
jgi:hypothetical protein